MQTQMHRYLHSMVFNVGMRILLLGGNGFGKIHALSYKNLGLEFSVFARKDDVLKEYREKYRVNEAYNDIEEAMKSDFDVVDIVLPHNLHFKYARKAMEQGKHVLIEKPIASTMEESKKLISLAEEKGVKFMVAEQYFFDAALQHAITLIAMNKIGKVHTIIVRDQRYFTNIGWRTSEAAMGGGALIDGGVHYIEALLDLGGPFDSIQAFTYKGGKAIEGEDNSMALFSFSNGAHGLFYYSWSYNNAPALPAYEIIGSEGSIYEDIGSRPFQDFKIQNHPRHVFGFPVLNGTVSKVEVHDVFDREISGFLKSVEKDTPVPYDPALALRNLETVMKIYGR